MNSYRRMPRSAIVLALMLSGCAAPAPSGKYDFDRFNSELPQLLETDTLTVMVRGTAIDLGAYVCNRVGVPTSAVVAQEVEQWKKRNERFTKGAGSAINAFASRIEGARGGEAKQSYMQQTLFTTAKEGHVMVTRQFGGANAENSVVPSPVACTRMAEYLRSGAADIVNNPEITRALTAFMDRSGTK